MIPFTPRNTTVAVLLLGLGAVVGYFASDYNRGAENGHVAEQEIGGDAVLQAYAARRSDEWLEASGVVTRTLADDQDGDRHQRFIVEVSPGHTVLVAHNIDLAPRVPLKPGDEVVLRGEYEWNERGGVLHWTHHDPRGRHGGGWVRHAGKTYR